MVVRARILGESVMQVGEVCVGTDSPRRFALLLYLSQAEGRPVHKSELRDLLFPDIHDDHRASQNLRQLLYKLRGLGAPVLTEGDRLRLPARAVSSSLDDFACLHRDDRVRVPASRLAILPAYEPDISPQLAEWVETLRASAEARVRNALRSDLRGLVRECDWPSVVATGRTLQELHVVCDEVVGATAEGLSCLGRKLEALDEIEAYTSSVASRPSDTLQSLRARIGRSLQRPRVRESGFHGRTDVMRSLAEQWSHALDAEPQLAVVLGAAGIGKTRLSAQLRELVVLRGGASLTHRCDPSDETRPLAPFRQLLAELRSMRGSLGASPELRQHLDRLASDGTDAVPMDPFLLEATRTELQLAIVDLMDAVASEKPLLLVLDDAQFLDSASSAVLRCLHARRCGTGLMILCCFRGTERHQVLGIRDRVRVHRLEPVSEAASLAILGDLLPERRGDGDFLPACAARGGGNPYFLHAIAKAVASNPSVESLPSTVMEFATAAYFALASTTRSVFESCLLLGHLATVDRIRHVTGIDGPPLLDSLRTLEDHGLVVYANGELRCAHALLEEATRTLIPAAVTALLHEHIAIRLEHEYSQQQASASLAWAAAKSWLAAGDMVAASRLMQLVAANAFALGEPNAAADALLQLPLQQLSLVDRAAALRALASYATAGGNRDLACIALQSLLSVSEELAYSATDLADIRLRLLEAEGFRGDNSLRMRRGLQKVLDDGQATALHRARAAFRLLISADRDLDRSLGTSTMEAVSHSLTSLSNSDPIRLRTELVHATVFGDQPKAHGIAARLLGLHPAPDLSLENVESRRNAAFALARLGDFELANSAIAEDFEFLAAHRVNVEAAQRALLLADNALCEGDKRRCASWLTIARRYATDYSDLPILNFCLLSASATFALAEDRLEEADALVCAASDLCIPMGQRSRAVWLSLLLRIRVQRGEDISGTPEHTELTRLFKKGARMGAQDAIVEALWMAQRRTDGEAATALLSKYIAYERRETSPPWASLRYTTRGDDAWQQGQAEPQQKIEARPPGQASK